MPFMTDPVTRLAADLTAAYGTEFRYGNPWAPGAIGWEDGPSVSTVSRHLALAGMTLAFSEHRTTVFVTTGGYSQIPVGRTVTAGNAALGLLRQTGTPDWHTIVADLDIPAAGLHPAGGAEQLAVTLISDETDTGTGFTTARDVADIITRLGGQAALLDAGHTLMLRP
jgi:hypothetical protein